MESKGNGFVKILVALNLVLIIFLLKPYLGFGIENGFNVNDLFSFSNTGFTNGDLQESESTKVCYIQLDTLDEGLLEMDEVVQIIAAEKKINEEKINNKYKEFQRWQTSWGDLNNLTLKQQRQYQLEVQHKEQEFLQLQDRLEKKFIKLQEDETLAVIDRICDASEKYAQKNGYDLVLAYRLGQHMFYGSPKLDITQDLIQLMNSEYKANK